MDINSAIVMARSLMVEHGVGRLSFGFHDYPNRPSIVGHTHFSFVEVGSKTIATPIGITMCDSWVSSLDVAEVREVILHEIAHARAPYNKLNAHDENWAVQCRLLGIPATIKFKSKNTPHTVRT